MARRGVQGDRGENGTLSEKLERGVAPIDMGGMDLGHGTWDNQAGPDSKDLGGTGRSIHHHHLEADMVHVCAGIHFYSGTCERWRIWNKPRYRQFSVVAP